MLQRDISFYVGGSIGQCVRCGSTRRLNDMALEWDGARVCIDSCLDPLPDTMRPPSNGPEGLPRPDASPESPNEFVQGPYDPSLWPSSSG